MMTYLNVILEFQGTVQEITLQCKES